MNRRDSRHGFETRLPTRSLPAIRRVLPSMLLNLSASFMELTLRIEQIASLCVTVRSCSVCDEGRAT
jgi:hypothetical protein